jgi:hypothetical protein
MKYLTFCSEFYIVGYDFSIFNYEKIFIYRNDLRHFAKCLFPNPVRFLPH